MMLELEWNDRRIEGMPVDWSASRVRLLGRDGRLWDVPPAEVKSFRRTASQFTSYSLAEMRGQLMREFGHAFDVSGAGLYLVVHPKGEKDQWAHRFEDIYRVFVRYFSVRGLAPARPAVPLVAVVFPTRQGFAKYAAQTGARIGPGVLGYYSPSTNRVLLYDVSRETGQQEHWQINAETIIHEAAHQVAFNTGIHSRSAMPPRWVAEGLGTLFEAPGVWAPRKFPNQQHRFNRVRLRDFQNRAATRPQGFLPQFVSSDRIFGSDPLAAYAEAWALTFFLMETRPRDYAKYLGKTAQGAGGMDSNAVERLKTFTDCFGADLQLLEAHYLRYIGSLK